MKPIKQFIFLMRETIREWNDDNASAVAAALAYYAIFSLSPLLIIFALVLGLVMDQATFEQSLVESLSSTVGTDAADIMRSLIGNVEIDRSNVIATIIWFSFIVWGASGMFAQLERALNRIWEVKAKPKRSPVWWVINRIESFALVAVAAVTIFAIMVINTGLSTLIREDPNIAAIAYLIRPLQLFIAMSMLTLLIAAIFKFLPDVIIRWKDVLVGAFFTAFLVYAGQFAVGLYLTNANVGSVFGAAGSLTAILVWIYYTAQILLFGAEFTEVWARHHGAYILPDKQSVWTNPFQAKREAESADRAKLIENVD